MPTQHGGVAQPKPEAPGKTRRRKQRTDAQLLTEMRDVVWVREQDKLPFGPQEDEAMCQACGRWVFRSADPEGRRFGHVHHTRGRRLPFRYDPDLARLLCLFCHRKEHGC